MADNRPETTGTPAPPQARLEHLDPHVLQSASNVRTDLRLDKDFVDSVRQHGILVPIVAHRGPDDTVTIAYGHRRAAAAIEVGLPTVPTLVHDQGAAAQSGADRVLTQVVENGQRAGLSTAERVGAYRQLAAFGLSATQIARRSSTRRVEVEQALKVAGSDLATAATARYDLTLDQAATLSDFDDDKDAVTALVAGAKTGQFAHVAQRLRDQRDYDQAVTALSTRLGEQGVAVLDDAPEGGSGRGAARRLDGLAQDGQPLEPESHRDCPGHAAYLERSWGEDQVQPVWVCTDPGGNGHTDRHRRGGSPAGPGVELSEAEKAERRQVRANNTDWRSAETVRRDFLRQLLARKTPPAGTRRFLAESLLAGDHSLRRALERGHPLARDLLGLDPGAALATALEGTSEPRTDVVALGAVLAAHEDATGVHTWRHPDPETRRYLDFLAGAGYPLSPLEHALAGPPDPPAPTALDGGRDGKPRAPRPRSTARGGRWAPGRGGAAVPDSERTPPSVA